MSQNSLIEILTSQNAKHIFKHETNNIRVLDTHASWVILTGKYAYKIKKSVDFGFLDYTTLEKRKKYCKLEFVLNQPLAGELYIGVLAIINKDDEIILKPIDNVTESDNVIEYTLKMHEFSQEELFISLIKKPHKIKKYHIDNLAAQIAEFHIKAENNLPNESFGEPEQIKQPVIENFTHIRELLTEQEDFDNLEKIAKWAKNFYEKRFEHFVKRKENKLIRACHGDMHLGNIILHKNKPIIFDCIEFNKEFHWIDIIADVGFLIMDLDFNNNDVYSYRLLNKYLHHTGDYQSLAVLPYYLSYRAIVRAKINLLQKDKGTEYYEQYRKYIDLALKYTTKPIPTLVITHGASGSGKTYISRLLSETYQLIHVSSDIERKRLANLHPYERANDTNIYNKDFTVKTYDKLLQEAKFLLKTGYSVVVDATFLKKEYRDKFYELTQELGAKFGIASLENDPEILKSRITKRAQNPNNVSDATHDVLEKQLEAQDPLSELEEKHCLDLSKLPK